VELAAKPGLHKELSLIIATPTAMNYQDIGTGSAFCEFDIPIGRRYDCALSTDPLIGPIDIPEICCRN